jgi:hypothetical protein
MRLIIPGAKFVAGSAAFLASLLTVADYLGKYGLITGQRSDATRQSGGTVSPSAPTAPQQPNAPKQDRPPQQVAVIAKDTASKAINIPVAGDVAPITVRHGAATAICGVNNIRISVWKSASEEWLDKVTVYVPAKESSFRSQEIVSGAGGRVDVAGGCGFEIVAIKSESLPRITLKPYGVKP